MIVKNEEGGLERAVNSVKDIVQEVIIGVDKNSTDKTLEIAKHIADVAYEYEWTNDFAAARNTYLGKATGDWVIFLDGHEYIKKYQHIDWDETAKLGDCIRIQIVMEDGSTFKADRIFKNGIKFKSRIHNYPDVKRVIDNPEFLIIHDRLVQIDEVVEARNKQRSEMTMENMGGKKDSKSLYYVGREYYDTGHYEKAIKTYKEYYKKYLEIVKSKKNTPERIAEKRRVIFSLSRAYYKNGELVRAINELNSEDLKEFMFQKGQIYSMEGNHIEAIKELFMAYVTEPTGDGFNPVDEIEHQIWDLLSVSLYHMKQYEMAYTATQKALEYKDNDQIKSNARLFAHFFKAIKEKGSEYYDQLFKNGYNTTRYKDIYEIIMNMLGKMDNPKVLELACGVGSLGKIIIDKGYKYKGFDFSKNAIKYSKKLNPKGDFHVGDVYDKKEYEGDYNTIITTELLEHVDDYKVLGLIPKGTTFIASIPNFGDVAHLRTYESKEFIEKRFNKFINIERIFFSKELGIYVFKGIIK